MTNLRRKQSEQLDRNRRSSSPEASHEPRHRRSLELNSQGRLARILMVLGLGALGLGIRLVWLQIVDAENLERRAQLQQSVTIRPFVPRRTIVDRSNNQIAIDRPSYTFYARPKYFSEVIFTKGKSKKGTVVEIQPLDMAQRIAPILDKQPEELLAKFYDKRGKIRSTAVLIGSGLSESIKNRIQALKLEGLDISQGELDYTRFYPQEDLLASVLGYINQDRKAPAGVERSQSAILERKLTEYPLTKEATGNILPDRVTADFLHTDDLKLRLSIDLRLQRAARAALEQQIKVWNAKRGTVIVMDADTGALRSLVVWPTYDPNNYIRDVNNYRKIVGRGDIANQDRATTLLENWAVSEPCEPGSTFKPINIAIALENGVIKPNTLINDTGSITVFKGLKPIRNSHFEKYGEIDIAKVLEVSSNVGMVKIMQKLNPVTYYNWIQRIGLGQKYGIDLPSEGLGRIHSRHEFLSSPAYPANAAFGQGFTLTPLQMVTLLGSIANGGKLVTPHVVEGLFDSAGLRKDKPTVPQPTQIFSPANTESVLKMMETVVVKGSGKNARISGYRIAGKTGTAQQVSNGGYGDDNRKITSFVGILPVDSKHRYVVFAAIDRPQGGIEALGSTVAAPVVKAVMESLISIEGISPSDPSQVGKEPPVIK
ncbi:MAG: penicillin-binding protein 2 [Chamaesiphon sp.]|nr:penicillin-binding protein 2 [Chamaesiphon sp.]